MLLSAICFNKLVIFDSSNYESPKLINSFHSVWLGEMKNKVLMLLSFRFNATLCKLFTL